MNFVIRQAKISETKLLSNLALRSKAYWGYSQEFINACRQELSYTEDDFQNQYFFVAEIDFSVIGFYGLSILSATEMELVALFIEPSQIQKGYGRKLIKHAKLTTIKLNRQRIIIHGDPNAQNFYLKIGAKLIGKIESGSIPRRYLPIFILRVTEINN